MTDKEILWEKNTDQLTLTAYHEAAHAVIIKRILGSTPHSACIKQIIYKDDTDGGSVMDPAVPSIEEIVLGFDSGFPWAERRGCGALIVCLAGYIAEALLCGERDLYFYNIVEIADFYNEDANIYHDLYKVNQIATILMEHSGDKDRATYMDNAVHSCEVELLSHWSEIEGLALLLLQHQELDGNQIMDYFETV